MEIDRLIEIYPRVFHMAEAGSWQSIRDRGLLSTSATLDKYGVQGRERVFLEEHHRPEKVTVGIAGDSVILRDQKPMAPERLRVALGSGLTPGQWYKIINSFVFFWAEEERLNRLLNAREYRHFEHDVLTLDLASLLRAHGKDIRLCPMNSGNTFPMPHPRDDGIFMPIQEFPVKKLSGRPAKPVVEVLVKYSVPDISRHVVEVRRMRGSEVLQILFRS